MNALFQDGRVCRISFAVQPDRLELSKPDGSDGWETSLWCALSRKLLALALSWKTDCLWRCLVQDTLSMLRRSDGGRCDLNSALVLFLDEYDKFCTWTRLEWFSVAPLQRFPSIRSKAYITVYSQNVLHHSAVGLVDVLVLFVIEIRFFFTDSHNKAAF